MTAPNPTEHGMSGEEVILRVLKLLVDDGPMCDCEIAKRLGLCEDHAHGAVCDLFDAGLVFELDEVPGAHIRVQAVTSFAKPATAAN